MNVFTTGRQFSNIWLRIEDGYSLSLGTDDGTEMILTIEEAMELADQLNELVADHNSIYADPVAEDDDV